MLKFIENLGVACVHLLLIEDTHTPVPQMLMC